MFGLDRFTLSDLSKKVFEILPNASIEEDNEGQLVIYTNLFVGVNDSLVEFVFLDDASDKFCDHEYDSYCGKCGLAADIKED